MANIVKTKFAGLLRGLFRSSGTHDLPSPSRPVATAQAPQTSPPPAPPRTPPTQPRSASTDEVELLLAPIVAALPMDLRAKSLSVTPAGRTIHLPVETVMSQLAFGAVKISFGELRQLAPGVFANTGGDLDTRPISLPLGEILSRLNPALLARRHLQKIEVADDIAGPFGGRGQGVTFTTQALKAPTPAPTPPEPFRPPPRGTTPVRPAAFTPPQAPHLNSPASVALPPATRMAAPTLPPAKPSNPGYGPNGNGTSNGNGHGANGTGNQGNGHGVYSQPPVLKISAVPLPPAATPSARPQAAEPTVQVTLGDLAAAWPAPIKNEITSSNLASAAIILPFGMVEPGLKRGRVTMTWKHLRTLAKPGSTPSPSDAMELDLPLKILAPAYLSAQRKLGKPLPKVVVSAEIPNLFFGFPQGPAEPPVAAPPQPAAFAPAPIPAAPKAGTARAADTNFYAWGENGESAKADEAESRSKASPATDFLNRQAHPKDVVARALALPGVAGAVVALPDGLRVASQVPTELNADTLAAFLPQIFDRVNQSTRELRMGALNNVGFTVGNVPWKIFRVNAVYFAVFGRAGESLPKSQLAGLAAELDRKKQQ